MPTRVIAPPDPLLGPGDIPGDHSPTDQSIAAMIASATGVIDGPFGILGRCFGLQTLELTATCWSDVEHLPYGPVVVVESISYVASDGTTVALDEEDWMLDGDYLYFGSSWSGPALASRAYPIKVRYQAGYVAGETGDIPDKVLAAITEGTQQLMLARSDQIGVRSVEVDDIETVTYLDSDKVSAIMKRASASLLSGLWVPTI